MLAGLRRRFHERRCHGPLAQLLKGPFQPGSTPLSQARLLAIDLELTHLDLSTAEIISVGFVPIDGLRVRLEGAERHLVCPEGNVERSAAIHLLRDEDLVAGRALPLETALERVLLALEGRTLLAHHAAIEMGMLSRECKRLWGAPLVVPVSDTLAQERRRLDRAGLVRKRDALRLPTLRAAYGLPAARLHGALSDAVATAELFLAMVAYRGPGLRLEDVWS